MDTGGKDGTAVIELLFRVLKKMDPKYPKLSFDPKTIAINPEQSEKIAPQMNPARRSRNRSGVECRWCGRIGM